MLRFSLVSFIHFNRVIAKIHFSLARAIYSLLLRKNTYSIFFTCALNFLRSAEPASRKSCLEGCVDSPVTFGNLNHYFGDAELRKQVLCDINIEIDAGEIVIVTGHSGSGKTTLLTLMGGLRSAQSGSLKIWGQEICGASKQQISNFRYCRSHRSDGRWLSDRRQFFVLNFS
jgi:ABC-type multidrug transport system fused ATPase/permease subunit